MSIQVSIRKAKCLDLKAYCVFAKEHDFIEVTEWINGEGYDVTISNAGGVINKTLSLTVGEFEALTVLVNHKD